MILGICFEKGGFRAAWLSGTLVAPVLIERERCINPNTDPAISANWAYGRFEQIIAHRQIDSIVAKITIDLKSQESVINHGMPLGILAYRAQQVRVPLSLITKNKLNRPGTYSLSKGKKPADWIDELRDDKPYWDAAARDAALCAASALR